MADTQDLLERWRSDLASWAIPDRITAQTAESPWVLPRQVFANRAQEQRRAPSGPSFERAWEALEQPGTVLDVGTGGGAASLPLAGRATELTAVDADDQLLDVFAANAAELDLPVRCFLGRWPDVAAEVPVADVVTCHHVLYNVPDAGPFLTELTEHARRRVVLEMTARHPLAGLNPLWERFHDLRRPERPTAEDALAILRGLGLRPNHHAWSRPGETAYRSFDDLVDVTRRRLCLPPERSAEVADALRDLGVQPERSPDVGSSGRELITVWWDGTAGTVR